MYTIMLSILFKLSIGSMYHTVLCLIHQDLHDTAVIDSLNHTVTTVMVVSSPPKPSTKGAVCSVTHKRKSGKIIRKVC